MRPGIPHIAAVAAAAILAALVACPAPAAAQAGASPSAPPIVPAAPQDGSSLVGTWSSYVQTAMGPAQETESFGPDGSYIVVVALRSDFLIKAWGVYQASPVSPGQVKVEVRIRDWRPQLVCTQAAGQPPACQPFSIPPDDSTYISFLSPDSFQARSVNHPEYGLVSAIRDSDPHLLQRDVPLRIVTPVTASSQGSIGHPDPPGTQR